jgi:hypothetical protein
MLDGMTDNIDLSACRKNTSCKVCSVGEWNIPVFLRLHELALREHYEYATLTKWLNTEIEKSNAMSPPTDQRPFATKQQVIVHFTKHVPVEEIARLKTTKSTAKTEGFAPFDPVVERKLRELTDHAAAIGVSALDDFQRFHTTLGRMQKRFDALDKFFDDPNFVPEKDLLLAYRAFGDSINRMLGESIKMRQQERILHNAITSTLDMMSLGSLQSILKGVEHAMVELRPIMSQPEKADVIVATLRDHVAQSLSSGAKTALDHLKSILRVA